MSLSGGWNADDADIADTLLRGYHGLSLIPRKNVMKMKHTLGIPWGEFLRF